MLVATLVLILVAVCSVESIENEGVSHSDCPFGNIDCEYPGNCGKYIDTNNNEICDHSE